MVKKQNSLTIRNLEYKIICKKNKQKQHGSSGDQTSVKTEAHFNFMRDLGPWSQSLSAHFIYIFSYKEDAKM